MNILILEPFLGGSHNAFLDFWQKYSRHSFTILGYPAHKWKWRMRHSSHTMAAAVTELAANGSSWDILFCSDMFNLPEFLGFAPPSVSAIPRVIYFHENQLTYPVRNESERDIHFGYTNYVSALAADAVWFNSDFHRQSFLEALKDLLARMPDNADTASADAIRLKSAVMPQGFDGIEPGPQMSSSSPHLLWAARWEHDKNPELFFEALYSLAASETPFRLSVVGKRFEEAPDAFGKAVKRLEPHIVTWGFVESRADYVRALQSADIFVSTANHEFLG